MHQQPNSIANSDQNEPIRIGVLGGGQLGRMLAEAASPFGNHRLQVHCLDPAADASASFALPSAQFRKGNFNSSAHVTQEQSAQDIAEFVRNHRIQVLTTEIEHVNCACIRQLASQIPDLVIEPSVDTIELIQDKFRQKEHLREQAGVAVPLVNFRQVKLDQAAFAGKSLDSKLKALHAAVRSIGEEPDDKQPALGYPFMLKRKRLAYDGRGNAVVKSPADIPQAVDSLLGEDWKTNDQNPNISAEICGALYAEQWASFTKELAVMVVRSRTGQVDAYPVVETVQKNSICHLVLAPAQIPDSAFAEAKQVAMAAVKSFSGAGIYGVELFLLDNGKIVFNEIAPRPHNSGHYTIEACETSQFEQHLRAVAGLPLGPCTMKVPASIMLNILGTGDSQETMEPVKRALAVSGASSHWYDKSKCTRGRKMCHITIIGTSMPDCFQKLEKITSDVQVDPGSQIKPQPLVGIIMGSDSDLPVMRPCAEILEQFNIPFELTIVSAHRTPDRLMEYARSARSRGLRVIVAGAGGAAHLPGMVAAMTALPVIGVPVRLKHLDGVDSLYSIVQMPRGVPVACVAIDNATNAGLLAVRMLGIQNPIYLDQMSTYQNEMRDTVLKKVEKMDTVGWSKYSAN